MNKKKVYMYKVGMIGSTRSFDKQRLVIQIAMNSIENQPLWKYEKETCKNGSCSVDNKYTVLRSCIRNSYMQLTFGRPIIQMTHKGRWIHMPGGSADREIEQHLATNNGTQKVTLKGNHRVQKFL